MIRLVLDTDVIVSGTASPEGASRVLLRLALGRSIEIAVSTPLFVEYEAVLLRPERLAAANATAMQIMELLDALAAVAIPTGLDFRWRPSGAAPDDELVLETAVNGQAHAIATFNHRHLRTAAARFGILADRPGAILRRMPP